MKNKKGFTLIELLAVIVVLAIIALIATPIVMNTIKNAKKGAAERTADNYIKQVETAVAESRIDGTKIANGTYNIQPDGNLCPTSGCGENDKDKITIDMSGNKPTSGIIKIENGGVSSTDTTMTVGDYDVKYNQEKNKYEAIEKGDTPQVEVLCTAKTAATTGNVPSGNYAYGDEYTCELGDNNAKTFFVLETNGNNVSLIMDKNIDSTGKGTTSGNSVAWISEEDWAAAGGVVTDAMKNDDGICQHIGVCITNEYGPITAQKYLKNSTTSWTKLTESQMNLPSYDQIYNAEGNKDYELPTWLIGNLNSSSASYGYWISTPYAYDSGGAWNVYYDDSVDEISIRSFFGSEVVGNDSGVGVRPVITISKSNLS